MSVAAVGVRMHSGWGALVVVAGEPPEVELADRRNIFITDPQSLGAKQPYHFAAQGQAHEAEQHIRHCAIVAEDLAFTAIRDLLEGLRFRHYQVTAAAILMASGRPLPALPQILASHALIHTAEGEFFRKAVWTACERLGICVTGIRERDLTPQSHATFGKAAPAVQTRIEDGKRSLGAPWTADQKKAALAAAMVLRQATLQRAENTSRK